LTPARRLSLQDDLPLNEANPSRWPQLTKEGVGETSGQTAGSPFGKGSPFREPVRQKKQVFFVRCGVRPSFAVSRGPRSRMKSGPDVFADALVPAARAFGVGALIQQLNGFSGRRASGPPISIQCPRPGRFRDRFGANLGLEAAVSLAACAVRPPARLRAMVIVVRNARVNRRSRSGEKACTAGTFAIPSNCAHRARLRPVHREP
jgi:hypothetical protein